MTSIDPSRIRKLMPSTLDVYRSLALVSGIHRVRALLAMRIPSPCHDIYFICSWKKHLKNGNLLVRTDSALKVSAFWAFERPPAGVRDPDARNLDLPPAHPHGLAARRGKAVLDQIGYHIDVEPMAEQRCPGAAAQSCVGEHFERAALLSAEVNPRHTNAPQRQKVLADGICQLTVCANRAAPIRNNTLKIN
jgi:hypothetical protein